MGLNKNTTYKFSFKKKLYERLKLAETSDSTSSNSSLIPTIIFNSNQEDIFSTSNGPTKLTMDNPDIWDGVSLGTEVLCHIKYNNELVFSFVGRITSTSTVAVNMFTNGNQGDENDVLEVNEKHINFITFGTQSNSEICSDMYDSDNGEYQATYARPYGIFLLTMASGTIATPSMLFKQYLFYDSSADGNHGGL